MSLMKLPDATMGYKYNLLSLFGIYMEKVAANCFDLWKSPLLSR